MSEQKIETAEFEITIFADGCEGYFEHKEYGSGGTLWFEGEELVDYDGVWALDKEVANALREHGYMVSWTCVAGENEPDAIND